MLYTQRLGQILCLHWNFRRVAFDVSEKLMTLKRYKFLMPGCYVSKGRLRIICLGGSLSFVRLIPATPGNA